MKTIFLSLSCALFFSLNVFAQPELVEENNRVAVEEMWLSRDDGSGRAVADDDSAKAVREFLTTDVPVHCAVRLASTKPVAVKMVLVAVKVAGVKPETRVVSVSYKTNGKQSRVNFTGSPEENFWTAGSYRIDIFLDEKPAASQAFEIKKAVAETSPAPKIKNGERQNPAKPRAKAARRFRKN